MVRRGEVRLIVPAWPGAGWVCEVLTCGSRFATALRLQMGSTVGGGRSGTSCGCRPALAVNDSPSW